MSSVPYFFTSTSVLHSKNNLCIEVDMQLEEVDKGVRSDSFGEG